MVKQGWWIYVVIAYVSHQMAFHVCLCCFFIIKYDVEILHACCSLDKIFQKSFMHLTSALTF